MHRANNASHTWYDSRQHGSTRYFVDLHVCQKTIFVDSKFKTASIELWKSTWRESIQTWNIVKLTYIPTQMLWTQFICNIRNPNSVDFTIRGMGSHQVFFLTCVRHAHTRNNRNHNMYYIDLYSIVLYGLVRKKCLHQMLRLLFFAVSFRHIDKRMPSLQ